MGCGRPEAFFVEALCHACARIDMTDFERDDAISAHLVQNFLHIVVDMQCQCRSREKRKNGAFHGLKHGDE